MYDADPFTARKEVDERQAKAAKKKEEASAVGSSSRSQPVSTEFAQSPEVRMAAGLRDMVEDAVKKASRRSVFLNDSLMKVLG